MKIERVVQTTEELGGTALIQDIRIGEDSYALRIHNGSTHLGLHFEQKGHTQFIIQVIDGMLRVSRMRFRPSHDHDDTEYLKTNKEGKLSWSPGMPHFWPVPSENQILEIPFGAVTEDQI